MDDLPIQPLPPEWVTSDAVPVKGIDLLGLRVPVERIGLTLLAAVTTISPTIRYISLRAWIARQYALAKLPDDWSSFELYAAKIEAAVAIGNLLNNAKTPGLVGLDDAVAKIALASSTVRLEALVQQLATRTYTGPSNALQISWSRDPAIPGLTEERGLPLANAVHELVSHTLFVHQFTKDSTTSEFPKDVLREFGAAFPVQHPVAQERKVLLDALFPPGQIEEIGALSTYRLLLELAKLRGRKVTPDDVFAATVSPPAELCVAYKSCFDGWLWYLARDVLAVTHEAVMKAVVEELRISNRPRKADELLTSLVRRDAELEQQLQSFLLLPPSSSPLDQPLSELVDLVRNATLSRTGDPARWSDPLQETLIIRAALSAGVGALALLPVAWLLVRERVNSSTTIPETYRVLLSYQGRGRIGLVEIINPVLTSMLAGNLTIRQACFDLANRTVNQHLHVAWSRLQQDPRKDVTALQVDGSSWAADRPFAAGRVASRLREGIGWLAQLGLVDDNGCTQDGIALLDSFQRIPASTASSV